MNGTSTNVVDVLKASVLEIYCELPTAFGCVCHAGCIIVGILFMLGEIVSDGVLHRSIIREVKVHAISDMTCNFTSNLRKLNFDVSCRSHALFFDARAKKRELNLRVTSEITCILTSLLSFIHMVRMIECFHNSKCFACHTCTTQGDKK